MKKLLDESAARLTGPEAERVWQDVRRVRNRTGAARAVPAWKGALAAAAVVVLLFGAARWFGARPDADRVAPLQSAVVAAESSRAEGTGETNPVPTASRAESTEASSTPAVASAVPVSPESPAPGELTGRVVNASGNPEAFVTVLIEGTSLGTQTDADGRYRIPEIPEGEQRVRTLKMGFEARSDTVRVMARARATLDMTLVEMSVAQLNEVQVVGRKESLVNTTSGTVRQSVSLDDLRSLPTARLEESATLKSGAVATGGELHFRGGRSIETSRSTGSGGGQAAAPQSMANLSMPVSRGTTSLGGTDPVNGEAFDAMFFQHYGVNPFIDPEDDPEATFAMDVDRASYTLARSYLQSGHLPPPEAVRVEEFVNAFDHGYPSASGPRDDTEAPPESTLAVRLAAAPSPFGPGLTLLRVGIKAREVSERNRKPACLTFVIDVSGSMQEGGRLETVKGALLRLLDRMGVDDRVGIVTFSNSATVVLPPLTLERRRQIEDAVATLRPQGGTNTEAGLRDGYAMAAGAWREGWINRVLLLTDGVANIGTTGADQIWQTIDAEARRGIELTAIGVGLNNYNDVLLEQLADRGDGNYFYIDGPDEADRVFGGELTGTLQTVARQAKVQVEFDPDVVRRYRLIGYENRDVADRDFRNDRVDAGEVGAGHEVTALFELKLAPAGDLRVRATGAVATVRIRYEDVATGRVVETTRTLDRADIAPAATRLDPMFRMDAATAEFAEILRGSYWARGGRLAEVVALAREARRGLRGSEDLDELIRLMESARDLRDAGPARAIVPDDAVRPRWEPDGDGRR